jgi:hypothetical protein
MRRNGFSIMLFCFLCAVILLCIGISDASVRSHRVVARHAFPPSRASLIAQNAIIDQLGLQRYLDDRDLSAAIERGDLVPIEETWALHIDRRLPKNRRYCRPWTHGFLTNMSWAFYAQFDKPLQINSAVRTVQVQRSLIKWNRNAAPAHGDTSSSHLAGLTVDIARRGLTKKQDTWIENFLLGLGAGVIVEKEIHQPCYHICVRSNQ